MWSIIVIQARDGVLCMSDFKRLGHSLEWCEQKCSFRVVTLFFLQAVHIKLIICYLLFKCYDDLVSCWLKSDNSIKCFDDYCDRESFGDGTIYKKP